MSEPLSLEDLKTHLRLDPTDTSEDAYLESLIVAARRAVEIRTNRTIIGLEEIRGDDLATAVHAMRLIVANWYANRESIVVGSQVRELPLTIGWLLDPLVRFASE